MDFGSKRDAVGRLIAFVFSVSFPIDHQDLLLKRNINQLTNNLNLITRSDYFDIPIGFSQIFLRISSDFPYLLIVIPIVFFLQIFRRIFSDFSHGIIPDFPSDYFGFYLSDYPRFFYLII